VRERTVRRTAHLKLAVLDALCMAGLTACAASTPPGRFIPDAQYTRVLFPEVASTPGAQPVGVSVRAGDGRFIKSHALVVAVRSSMEAGLASRGFVISENGVLVELKVEHVYVDTHAGFWSSRQSSEMIVRCRVGRASGVVTLDTTYIGRSGEPRRAKNVDEVRQAALADVIGQVLADEAFMSALVAAR
jgi:YajG family uncharacterized lipoprotein